MENTQSTRAFYVDGAVMNENYLEGEYDEYGEYEDTGETDEGVSSDEPPHMPNQYYSEVENFLNRPAPSFSGSVKATSNESKKSNNLLPAINKPKKRVVAESKVGSMIKSKSEPGKIKSSQFDSNLLAQAFQYVDRIQRENTLDDFNPPLMDRQSVSAPLLERGIKTETDNAGEKKSSSNSNLNSKAKKSGSSIVRRLRAQTQENGKSNFDTTIAPPEAGSARNVVDFDALVANFQDAITLNKLKAELEQSKASMMKSEECMKKITHEFSRKLNHR